MANEEKYTDENNWLKSLQAGDENVFTQIYHRYWQRVYAVGFYFSKKKVLAEEVVQKVFLSLWERRAQLTISLSLEGYLATAAKYCVLDMLLKEERRKQLSANIPVQNQAFISDETLQAKIIEEYLQKIIERLPAQTKLVFHYSRNTDLTNKEIAEKLEVSAKTVEAHITKALKTLRNSLDDLKIFFL